MYTQILKIIKISALAATLSLGISFAYAWTEPTQGPTGGNTASPLNTSTANQTKTGGILSVFDFWVDSALVVLGGASFGGNVGIGTATLSNKLTLSSATSLDGIHATDGSRWIKIMPGTVSTGSFNGIVQANDNAIIYSNGTKGTGNFVIAPWASGTSGLRMDASGNVGIGTATPTFKFEVSGDPTNIGKFIKFNNTNTSNQSNVMILQNNSSTGYSSIDFNNSSGSQMGFIGYGNSSASTYGDKIYLGSMNKNIIINPGTANVGIGTTAPTAKLEVNLANTNGWSGNLKAMRLFSPDNNYYLDTNTYVAESGNVGYQFSPNGNTGMVITTPGNVGIGTTAPGYKLDVNGIFRAVGSIIGENTMEITGDATLKNNLTVSGNLTANSGVTIQGVVLNKLTYANLNEDSYGSWSAISSKSGDTCNGDNGSEYTCGTTSTQTCYDTDDNYNQSTGSFFNKRTVACKANAYLTIY